MQVREGVTSTYIHGDVLDVRIGTMTFLGIENKKEPSGNCTYTLRKL